MRWGGNGILVPSLLALFASGCGGDDEASDSSASDVSTPDGGLVAGPDIPWLDDGVPPITLIPCPDGWREVVDSDDVTTCDPHPEGGALDCAPGEAHFAGEPACAPVGSACPAGDFSAALPADANVVYVQPGASGDGSSPATPYGSLGDFGFGGLSTGTVIALSRGTHVTDPIPLVRGVILWGACAAATVLTNSTPSETDSVVVLRDASGEVRDLTVADSPRGGIYARGGASELVLEGVVVRSTQTVAVAALGGAQLTATALVVRDTRGRASDGAAGRSLEVQSGSTATASRAVFGPSREVGVSARDDGSTLALADVIVRDTDARAIGGTFGTGLNVELGATADVRRAAIERSRRNGVFVGDAGSVVLSHVTVRDTLGEMVDGSAGRSLTALRGSVVDVSRAVLERGRESGVTLGSDGTTATLRDLVVRDHAGLVSDGRFGMGVTLGEGAAVDLSNALLVRNRAVGVFLQQDDTTATLADVLVRETAPQEDGLFGRGLNVQDGAAAEASRMLIERAGEVGILVGGPGATLMLGDAVVRDTEGGGDELGGRGLNVQLGATGVVNRAVFERNRDLGVYAWGAGTDATLTDVRIQDTLARACAETSCIEFPAGHGLGVYEDATLTATGFRVARSDLCGVHVATRAQLDLAAGEVREQPIGVCLQVEPYDVARLRDGVRFADNEVNLQSTTLPIPEPAAATGATP